MLSGQDTHRLEPTCKIEIEARVSKIGILWRQKIAAEQSLFLPQCKIEIEARVSKIGILWRQKIAAEQSLFLPQCKIEIEAQVSKIGIGRKIVKIGPRGHLLILWKM